MEHLVFFDQVLFGSFDLAILVKLMLAGAAGALIGMEREKHGRPAGLRTHLLVAMGACLMMIVSEAFYLKYGDLSATGSPVRLDPSRVAAQIVAGIGFIGAGVIVKEGLSVRGLTTSASLWMAAGLGMAFGMGLFGPAAMAFGLSLIGLVYLKRLEPIIKKDRFLHLTIVVDLEHDIYPDLERIFEEKRLRISDVAAETDLERKQTVYHLILTQHRQRIGREITSLVLTLPGVRRVSYR